MANSAKNIDIFFEIGVLMWTSTPYIYQCYRDLPALMTDAYLRVVRNLHMPGINKRKELEEAPWVIWSLYWEYLMNDPDKTIFSWRYYLSGYFGTEVQEFRKM